MASYAGTSPYAAARPVFEACGRRRRFFAALLDSAILGFVGLIIGSAILSAMVDSPRWLFSEQPNGTITLRDEVEAASLVIMVAMTAITAFYYVGFHLMTGQTPGKRMLGIKVVDIHSGEAPNLGTSILRYVIYVGPWFAGYAMSFAGPLASFSYTMDICVVGDRWLDPVRKDATGVARHHCGDSGGADAPAGAGIAGSRPWRQPG